MMMTILKYICFGLFWMVIISSFALTAWFSCILVKELIEK